MNDMTPRFGPAGISDSFAAQGYKTSLDIPAYTAGMGLDAFEYQCGHGVRLAEGKARQMAALAAEKGIVFSVHAPYYISMSSLDEEKRLGSIRYLLQSAQLCRALGGRRIIFHPGSCGKQSRAAALDKALDTLRRGGGGPGRGRLRGHDPLPRDPGQDRPAGRPGRGAGPVRGGPPDRPLHRLWPPERPHPGGHPLPGGLRPPSWTGWGRPWGTTVPGPSTSIFPGSNFRPGAKNATGPFADTQYGP